MPDDQLPTGGDDIDEPTQDSDRDQDAARASATAHIAEASDVLKAAGIGTPRSVAALLIRIGVEELHHANPLWSSRDLLMAASGLTADAVSVTMETDFG